MLNDAVAAEAEEACKEMRKMLALAEIMQQADDSGKTDNAAIIELGEMIEHACMLAASSLSEMVWAIKNQKAVTPSKAKWLGVVDGK